MRVVHVYCIVLAVVHHCCRRFNRCIFHPLYTCKMATMSRTTSICFLVSTLALLLQQVSVLGASRNGAFINYKEQEGSSITEKHVILTTKYGKIRIRPRSDISPKIVALVLELANKAECLTCRFYRHEPVPENWGSAHSFWGPPYALLQGSLADMSAEPPFEGSPMIKKGDVCIIPGSKEFFIATADHEEWGHAHSVWGKVELGDSVSWTTIENIPTEPFTTITDNSQPPITTRWLTPNATVTFTITYA